MLPYTPPPSRRGRVTLLVLCLVILALLLAVTWSRVTTPDVDATPAERAVPAATHKTATTLVDSVAPLRVDSTGQTMTAATRAQRHPPRRSLGATVAVNTTAPASVRRDSITTPTAVQSVAPTAPSRADSAPTALLRDAEASTQFVVLSAGDEELAPMSSIVSAEGPMLPLNEFVAQIGGVLTDDGDRITIDVRADDPVSVNFSASLRRGQRQEKSGTRALKLSPGDLERRDGQWFVSLGALHELTALDLNFDARSQSVVITSPRSAIPRFAAAVRRMERTNRPSDARDLLAPMRPNARSRIATSSLFPTSASLTYSLSQDNTTGLFTGQGTVGAALLGGGLSVTGAIANGGQRTQSPDITWLGGNPLSRFLTQARVGWGAATGFAPWPGYGVSLTNAPFARAMALGTLPLSGISTPGAEIEIQSAGRLLGVVTADERGQWSSQVPVGFGQNLLDIATYGPQGVTRRSILRSLEGEHLPAGKVEYGITAQRGRNNAATCSLLGCGDLGNADLRWGVSSRVTLRAGVSSLRRTDSLGTRTGVISSTPYASVVAAPTGWLQFRQDVGSSSWLRTRVIVQPTLAFRADAGHETFPGGSSAVPFWLMNRAANTEQESFASVTYRPISTDLGRLWINLLGRRTEGTRSNAQLTSAAVGARAAGSLVSLGADRIAITPIGIGVPYTRTRFSTSATIPQLRRGPRWLATSFATLGASYTPAESHIPGLTAGLTSTLFGSLLMQLGADWRPGAPPALRLQFQQRTSAAIVMQSLSTSRVGDAPVAGSTSILGSVLMPLNGKPPALSSDLVALRARVRVQAFLDRDGNGLSDPSEDRVPDLSLFVGTQRTVTDATGVAIVDGLPVLDALMVRPEELFVNAADGTIWVLAGPSPWARLVPYGETLVQLPYVLSAQATVLADGELLGTTLWISPLDQPDVPAVQRRFFADGSAPLGPLAPGQYRVEARRNDNAPAPLASCLAELRAGEISRLRFPPGLHDSTPRCVVDAPAEGQR
jgi:hypothetical protein